MKKLIKIVVVGPKESGKSSLLLHSVQKDIGRFIRARENLLLRNGNCHFKLEMCEEQHMIVEHFRLSNLGWEAPNEESTNLKYWDAELDPPVDTEAADSILNEYVLPSQVVLSPYITKFRCLPSEYLETLYDFTNYDLELRESREFVFEDDHPDGIIVVLDVTDLHDTEQFLQSTARNKLLTQKNVFVVYNKIDKLFDMLSYGKMEVTGLQTQMAEFYRTTKETLPNATDLGMYYDRWDCPVGQSEFETVFGRKSIKPLSLVYSSVFKEMSVLKKRTD